MTVEITGKKLTITKSFSLEELDKMCLIFNQNVVKVVRSKGGKIYHLQLCEH